MPKVAEYPVLALTSASRVLGTTAEGTGNTVLFDLTGLNGKSAYQSWLDQGNTGTEADFINDLRGENGESAYELWLDSGEVGTVQEFLDSLKGRSAYQEWLALGNVGDEEAFVASLKGDDGDSAYEIAVSDGFIGTEAEWLASLEGDDAYEVAVANGFIGSRADWLISLQGEDAYEIAVDQGFVGNRDQWLESLRGKALRVNEWGVILNEAKIAAVEAMTEEYILVVAEGGDQRSDTNEPAELIPDGDLERQMLVWNPDTGLWYSNGPFTGVEGPVGRPGVPTAYGYLNEDKIAEIQTAGVNVLYSVTFDTRAFKNVPATLNGDQSRMLLEYIASTNAWSIKGQWTGFPGNADSSGPFTIVDVVNFESANRRRLYNVTEAFPPFNRAPLANVTDGHQVLYEPGVGWTDLGKWQGPEGEKGDTGDIGPPGIPDFVGPLTTTLVTDIETAGVDRLIVASPDVRDNKSIPSSLTGDKTYQMIQYIASSTTWEAKGRWQGEAGSLIPSYECFVGRPSGIAPGGYPFTGRARVPATLVEFWGRTAPGSGEVADVIVAINGFAVLSATLTDTISVSSVNIALGYGDRLTLNILDMDPSPMPRYVECGLSV